MLSRKVTRKSQKSQKSPRSASPHPLRGGAGGGVKGTLNLHQIKHKLLSFVVRVVLKHNYRLVFLRQQKPLDQRSLAWQEHQPLDQRSLAWQEHYISPSTATAVYGVCDPFIVVYVLALQATFGRAVFKIQKTVPPCPQMGLITCLSDAYSGAHLPKSVPLRCPLGAPQKNSTEDFAYTQKVFCVYTKDILPIRARYFAYTQKVITRC